MVSCKIQVFREEMGERILNGCFCFIWDKGFVLKRAPKIYAIRRLFSFSI
jgi:hypothetical protein